MRKSSSVKSSTSRLITTKQYSSTTNTTEPDEIVVPLRIHRSPTAILEALASTVKRDPTATHYKYHDDPYFIPMSNYKKRVFSLSKESGRKAAHWVRQQHPELFTHRELDPPLRIKTLYKSADPPIEAFMPTINYNENSEVSEKDLVSVMKNNFVNDAVLVYNILKSKSPESLSRDLEQELLEFLCFYNENEPIFEEWQEEKFFSSDDSANKQRIKKWKNNSTAMSIFKSMKEKTPAAYCAIIQGMCKHFEAKTAYELYLECCENNIPLSTGAYNGLLSVVGFLKENTEMQWQLICELLEHMKSQNISPDLGTLNAVLESLSLMEATDTKENCKKVLAEFVNVCGIEPSLATWHFVLSIFYKDRGFKSDVLYSIMNQIEGQSFKMRDIRDTLFFSSAMGVCRHQLFDVQLAHRIHNLLLSGSNYDLVGDNHKESLYYRFYFTLICKNETFENVMKYYNDLVPHVYTPESSVMLEILKSIDINMATDYYPLIWSHILLFGLTPRQQIVQSLLQSMVRNLPPESDQPGIQLKAETSTEDFVNMSFDCITSESLSSLPVEENFARIAWDIWIKNQHKSENSDYWSAGMLSDIIYLLTRWGRIDDGFVIMKELQRLESSVGVPSTSDSLLHFAKMATKYGRPSYSAVTLKYLAECGHTESVDVANEILQTLLNRSKSDIDQLVVESSMKNLKEWTEDRTVIKLVEIIKQEKAEGRTRKADSSSSSSSSSSSDSESDEETEKKNN